MEGKPFPKSELTLHFFRYRDEEVGMDSERIQPRFSKSPDWRNFKIGDKLEQKNISDNLWYIAEVKSLDEKGKRVRKDLP